MDGVRRDEADGAAAVEFALLLPVLVLLLFGIIQFGVAFNQAQGQQAAAREGARLAAVWADNGTVAARVRESGSPFGGADADVLIAWGASDTSATSPVSAEASPRIVACDQANTGDYVFVTARDEISLVIPLWGDVTFDYDAGGSFRCEPLAK